MPPNAAARGKTQCRGVESNPSGAALVTTVALKFGGRRYHLEVSYNGHIVTDSHRSLVAPNLHEAVLDALVRPYPMMVNGTPTSLAFDTTTNTLEFRYRTRRPDGRRAPPCLETIIAVPARRYRSGYRVSVSGAHVISAPCAPLLVLRNRPRVLSVSVEVTPGSCG
jgi:endoglycosylceramidase